MEAATTARVMAARVMAAGARLLRAGLNCSIIRSPEDFRWTKFFFTPGTVLYRVKYDRALSVRGALEGYN
jgi:hypothetical protein